MKIDLVYLWVDDTDLNWQQKFSKYRIDLDVVHNSKYDNDAIDICRFYNNDELKYSLRSAEQYAPWINKIFIVTDNQIPDWLDINHPKIRIIDHKEIIPHKYLPLFNSCAIEACIPFIEELSEQFIYANDDMFFWDNVNEEFFFNEGKPIFRFADKISIEKSKRLYGHTIQRSYKIIKEKYPNLSYPLCFPHHNFDAYKKSVFLDCINEFKEYFDETLNHKFRERTDMQRCSVAYFSLAKGEGIFKPIKISKWQKYILKQPADSRQYGIREKSIPRIKKCKTKLMCLNDRCSTTREERLLIKNLLEERFNKKSSFEK